MTNRGQGSRALLSMGAYIFGVVAIVGGAFFATMALMPEAGAPNANALAAVHKIGPGYARMKPVDLGKPEKVVYSTPYYPHVARPNVARAKRLARILTAPSATATVAPPKIITAAVAQYSYGLPDIHRIY
jgi:hypothetical protein